MISILKLIFSLLNKKSLPTVIIGQNITNAEVNAILTPFTTNLWLSDGIFETINTKNLQDFLAVNDVNILKYESERRDCDDFAYMLQGDITRWYPAGSMGIVWGLTKTGGAHAWNFFIDENMKVKFLEPQTDTIFEPTTEQIWIMII